jgi:hypothetical protein
MKSPAYIRPVFHDQGVGEGTGLGLSSLYGIVQTLRRDPMPEPAGTMHGFPIYLLFVEGCGTEGNGTNGARWRKSGVSWGRSAGGDEDRSELASKADPGGYRTLLASSCEEALDVYREQGRKSTVVWIWACTHGGQSS